jgi:CrcB protein
MPISEPLVQAPLDGDAETLAHVPDITVAAPTTTPSPTTRLATLALEVWLILAGGIVGTLARIAVSLTVGHALDHGFPWDIALINVSGALLIGLLAGWRDPASRAHELIWLAGAVGFLGAYTTFSSFALGTVTLTASGHTLLALLYLGGSAALGLVAVELGLWLGRRWRRME